MNTQSNEKKDLVRKIECMDQDDLQKVKVFIAGMEAGREISRRCERRAGGVEYK